ncbi:ComEC family competence protein [Candidatus Gracilibacteria bacterium]|nr:ComEC family competence protein [Candidatus Gracilibacteria bacterium]
MLLLHLAIAYLCGTVLADVLTPPAPLLWAAVGVGVLLALVLRRSAPGRTVALCLLCLAGALIRSQAAQIPAVERSIQQLVGYPEVQILGEVAREPRRTEEGQQILLATESARVGDERRAITGLLLVQLPPYPIYRYGERLLLAGAVQEPRESSRPGEFDYRAYLNRKGIFVMMREPAVRPQPGGGGNAVFAAIYQARDYCRQVLLRLLPEPQASLAVGILLGLQSSIPDEVYAAFSTTGTSHILVVSGWNFTIVAAVLAGLATRLKLGKGAAFWGSLAVMWLYAFFVGASGAVLRAALMASLMVLARTSERRSEPWTLLAAACWAMCVIDPNTLWDLGFQLSALATASLFAFAQPTERLVARLLPTHWPLMGSLAEALTATLAAQILALPIILYNFGNMSLIAPLANVVLVPVVPYAMLTGTITLVLGLIWQPAGEIAALSAWLPLNWLAEGALILARAPYAAVQIPPFPLWMLLAYYAATVAVIVLKQRADAAHEEEAATPS